MSYDHLPPLSRRVPRFVEEYVKDRNGTRAAKDAGYSFARAHVTACELLKDPRVVAMVDEKLAELTEETKIEAATIVREWLALATADPSKIVHVRRVNCRYCNGVNHGYQWNAREYAEACDLAARNQTPPPDCAGGFEWRPNGDPHPECPECGGEGVEDVFFSDTDKLTGPERKLISSVKRTKDGLEIKMRDQDAALLHLAKHIGMLVERRELTGKDGRPLVPAPVPTDLPTDPQALAELYRQMTGA